MNRAQRRFEKFNAKRAKLTKAPVYRKRKIEDAHVEWLWRKIQSGLQLDFTKYISHRTFDKLVSLQELSK